jgi:hypothetical protein
LDPALLNKEKVRSFSKRVRSRVSAHHAFKHTRNNNDKDLAVISCAIEHEKIEQRFALFLIESFAMPS